MAPFDLIFCRNVMIYFDNTVRSRLLAEAYRLLKSGRVPDRGPRREPDRDDEQL